MDLRLPVVRYGQIYVRTYVGLVNGENNLEWILNVLLCLSPINLHEAIF